MQWYQYLQRWLNNTFGWTREQAFVARTYYESMRDNFEGYAWDSGETGDTEVNTLKAGMLEQLKHEFGAMDPLDGKSPTLGQLFKIELALIWLVPEEALRARFWTIEDRFRRVVPAGVVASYEASFLPDPNQPVPEPVLRQRARNLLDVIHANYLINLAREKSIKRMMTILALMALAIGIGSVMIIRDNDENLAMHGMVAIGAAGMFGAMISIIQRLQKATSRDAMAEDGIYGLIGLRIGWVSVLMSIGIGGVFAIFLYIVSAANLADLLLPEFGDVPSPDTGGSAVPPEQPVAGEPPAPPANGIPDEPPGDPALPPVDIPEGGKSDATAATKCDCREQGESQSRPPASIADIADALGLRDAAQFYKMLALGFISGFAERFVPDIINKLAKQDLPPSPAPVGGDTK